MASTRKRASLSTDVYRVLMRSSVKHSPSSLAYVQWLIRDETSWLELSFLDQSRPPVYIAVSTIAELAEASVEDLLALHLSPARDTIISDSLDVHLSVEGLIRDLADQQQHGGRGAIQRLRK